MRGIFNRGDNLCRQTSHEIKVLSGEIMPIEYIGCLLSEKNPGKYFLLVTLTVDAQILIGE